MLYQDALTGALHEAPDGQLYESDLAEYPYQMGEVYDGLGNPVGFLPFLPKIASLASSLLPKVGSLVGGLIRPGGAPAAAAAAPFAAGAAMGAMIPRPAFRPPWPASWVRPPLPYTGLGPRRLYMRCAVWPGPRALVPASAAQAPATAAAAAAQTAAAMQQAMGRRRRRRRR